MDYSYHNKLVNFIWSIADDCLRDVYVRGKYRDVILPMTVLRRLDALLEPTKDKVLEEIRLQKEELKLKELDTKALQEASGYIFYNTSQWTMNKLYQNATNSMQILKENFFEYLNGFSPNVKEIIEKFKLYQQIEHMAQKDILLDVLEKFVSPYINLTNKETTDPDGNVLPPLTNLGMGYVFEELIRRFNEENNEEAGEHFTPREVIHLMTHILYEPIKNSLPPVITIYDPACGSGGMLTESEKYIKEEIKANCDIYLYGKEINDETYAICKADMLIKGENPENIRNGSTLATDEFRGIKFDFMLSNPPYGKSWKSDEKYIKDGNEVIDPRFKVRLKDYWGKEVEADAVPRTSDGQLLFLMEMVDKVKNPKENIIGSRIASVHNGSSLFTGDAGSGESNIRRYIIENDMVEAIIQLPTNMFYNTGITTYIWILSNNKEAKRKGKIQLIDASKLYRKLRKNLGDKNKEFAPEHIQKIVEVYKDFKELDEENIASKIFENEDFGYYKVVIERPKRLKAALSDENIEKLLYDEKLRDLMQEIVERFGKSVYEEFDKEQIQKFLENKEIHQKEKKRLLDSKLWYKHKKLYDTAKLLQQQLSTKEYDDFNLFKKEVEKALKEAKIKLSAGEKNAIYKAVSWYDENAKKVIKKIHKFSQDELQKLLAKLGCDEKDLADFGYYKGEDGYIEYESESELRDSENIPLKQSIHDYFIKEVKPYVDEAWIDIDSVKIGYGISFNRYFYKFEPLRSPEEIAQEITELEKESSALLKEILGFSDEV